jgi:hypothetical protein
MAPFTDGEIKWRKGPGGKQLPYVTAASVVKRLNEVLQWNWWDRYRLLPDGSVMCRLTIVVGGCRVSREDVGVPSTQEGQKGRNSDALKRAARKFGVGLSLCFMAAPVARGTPPAVANSTPARPHSLPSSGKELEERLAKYDARLVEQGLCDDGDLLRYVLTFLADADHGSAVNAWGTDAIKLAVEATKGFEQRMRAKAARKEATRQRIASGS